MATIIGRNDSETVTDSQLDVFMQRMDRDGRWLTPGALEKMHRILTDCIPDTRTSSSQTDLAKYVAERIERDRDAPPPCKYPDCPCAWKCEGLDEWRSKQAT